MSVLLCLINTGIFVHLVPIGYDPQVQVVHCYATGLWSITQGLKPVHFLDLTLCFVKRAFHFVLHTGFHGIPPLGFPFDW